MSGTRLAAEPASRALREGMTTKIIVGAALAATLVAAGALIVKARENATVAPVTPAVAEQLFRSGQTYDRFVSSDTTRRAEWMRNYSNAEARVAEVADRVRAIPARWHVLIVAESWCGDAVNSVPYLARLPEENSRLDVRLLRIANAKALLRNHRVAGRSPTPLVILYDTAFVERGAWIERPAGLKTLIAASESRLKHDALADTIRKWRAADGGRSVLAEVLGLMERAG